MKMFKKLIVLVALTFPVFASAETWYVTQGSGLWQGNWVKKSGDPSKGEFFATSMYGGKGGYFSANTTVYINGTHVTAIENLITQPGVACSFDGQINGQHVSGTHVCNDSPGQTFTWSASISPDMSKK